MMLRLFKIVFPLVACIFLGKLVVEYWPEVVAANWQIDLPLLSLSLAALILVFLVDACGWWLILKGSGEQLSVFSAIAIWLRSSLSRYIPGVIWAYVSRVVLSEEHGVSRRNCIDSVMIESAMLALGSFTVGLPILLSLLDIGPLPSVLLAALCIAAILFGLSVAGFSLLKRLPLLGSYIQDARFTACKWRWTIYFFYSFFWLCFSAVFILFLAAINVQFDSVGDMAYAGSAFSASFCIGLILVVFPGGLGIREATLYGFLSTLISPPVAIAISVASRLWLITGELASLATYLLASFLRESRRRQ
jgi:uncharacterized membrane protein YbhN (UPF0104 family)